MKKIDNNNFYKYSACRRRFETYTKRSNEIINIENLTVIKQKDNKLFQINFESYFNIKKLIFESIEDQHKLEEDIYNIIDTNSLNFY